MSPIHTDQGFIVRTLLAIIATVSLNACAVVPNSHAIVAKQSTCAELQEIVSERGTVTIKGRLSEIPVHKNAFACPRASTEPFEATFISRDSRKCFVGYSCRQLQYE